MSLYQINLAWEIPLERHTLKFVLIALSHFANDHGVCWPSATTLAERCSMSRKAVMEQVVELRKMGLLEVEKTPGKGNRYTLRLVTGSDGTSHPRLLVTASDQSPTVATPVTGSDGYQSPGVTGPVTGSDTNSKEYQVESSLKKAPVAQRPPRAAPSGTGFQFADWFRTMVPQDIHLSDNWRTGWARTYDQLIASGRTDGDISRVVRWARADDFWAANFLSPAKLLKRKDGITYFDAFLARMKSDENTAKHKRTRNGSGRNDGTCNAGRAQDYANVGAPSEPVQDDIQRMVDEMSRSGVNAGR